MVANISTGLFPDEQQSDQELRAALLRGAIFDAAAKNPDQVARERRLANVTGLSRETVRSDPKFTEQVLRSNLLNYSILASQSPRTADFLLRQENAEVAHDDVENLSVIERTLKATGYRAARIGLGALLVGGKAGYAVADALKAAGLYTREDSSARKEFFDFVETNLKKTGKFESNVTWEDVKRAPLAYVLPFMLEQSIISAPDMLASLLTWGVPYAIARTGELAFDRAQNDKRDLSEITFGDFLAAMPAAVGNAILERFAARISLGLAKDVAVTSGRTLGRAVGKASLTEAGTEFLQEVGEYAATTIGTATGFDPELALESGIAGAVGGFGAGAIYRTASGAVELTINKNRLRRLKALDAELRNQNMTELLRAVNASLLKARDPQTFEQFVRELEVDDTVYIDAAAAADVLNQSGLAPEELDVIAPGLREAVAQSVLTRGLVSVPVSTLLSRTAGSKLEAGLLPHLKTDPDAMSLAEAQEFRANEGAELMAEIEQVLNQSQIDEERAAQVEQVYQGLLEQLNSAGRFTPKVNERYARMYATMFDTLSRRLEGSGLARRVDATPVGLARLFKLNVSKAPNTSENTLEDSEYDQEGRRRTDTEAFKRWFRNSVVKEPVYHGTLVDDKGGPDGLGFTVFRTDKELGAHFGTKEQANIRIAQLDPSGTRSRSRVYPVWLSIQNPLRLPDIGIFDNPERLIPALEEVLSPEEFEFVQDKFNEVINRPTPSSPAELIATIRQALVELGYDGIVYRNRNEVYLPEAVHDQMLSMLTRGLEKEEEVAKLFPEFQDSYIIFDPSQAKSVFNPGKFDPEKPSIMEQPLGSVPGANDLLPADFDWRQANILNIGINTTEVRGPNAPPLSTDEVLAAVQEVGGKILDVSLQFPPNWSEPTFVIVLEEPLTPEQVYDLSVAVFQQAIGYTARGVGGLVGPNPEPYGNEFNPKYLLLPSGQTMAAAQAGEPEPKRSEWPKSILRSDAALTPDEPMSAEPMAGLLRRVRVDGQIRTFGPFLPALRAAKKYAERMGFPALRPARYVRVNEDRARKIAQAYEEMKHAPDDPMVAAAYAAMMEETIAQWEAIAETGLQISWIDGEDPYGNPRNAILDVVENNHLWVLPTDVGFGSGGEFDPAGNPLLAFVPGLEIGGRKVRYNDVFRIVHDYFGHIKEGVGFRAEGEENAWRIHSLMYSPLARRAMTTETRGQNSWVNYGPHGEHNRTANAADTIYGDQKVGLLPDWVVFDGAPDTDGEAVLYQQTLDEAIARHNTLFRSAFETEAAWTPERLEALLSAYAYTDDPEKSKAYVTRMSPDQFLGLTASLEGQARMASMDPAVTRARPLDVEELANQTQPIYLVIEPPGEPSNVQREMGVEKLPAVVVGHEGRHRMTALKAYGIDSVPVVVIVQSKRVREPEFNVELIRQSGRLSPMDVGSSNTVVDELIPISYANKDRLRAYTGNPEAGVLFQQSSPYIVPAPFYSPVERALQETKTNKARGVEWLNMLRNMRGMKQPALFWTGIEDFLNANADVVFTREQLLEFAQENGIRIKEVELLNLDVFRRWYVERALENDEEADLAQITIEAEEEFYESNLRAKYASTTFAGGSDYKELLIILPDLEPKFMASHHDEYENVLLHIRFKTRRDSRGRLILFVEEIQSDLNQQGRELGYTKIPDPKELLALKKAVDAAYEARTKAKEERDEALKVAVDAIVKAIKDKDATLPNDETRHTFYEMLLISLGVPIISDSSLEIKRAQVLSYIEYMHNVKLLLSYQTVNRARFTNFVRIDNLPEVKAYDEAALNLATIQQTLSTAEIALEQAHGEEGIPANPFMRTKDWTALAIKRVIHWAAMNGFEGVAWTTGSQQLDRYPGLASPELGRLRARPAPEAYLDPAKGEQRAFFVRASELYFPSYMPRENRIIIYNSPLMEDDEIMMTESQMRAVFGDDLTQKLIDANGADVDSEDFRIGNQGMIEFYDRIVPSIARDIIKKTGGKLETFRFEHIPAKRYNSKLLNQLQTELNSVKREMSILMSKYLNLAEDRGYMKAEFPNTIDRERALADPEVAALREQYEILAAQARELNIAVMETTLVPQPGFLLTDELIKQAEDGFSMFQRAGSQSAPRGQIAIPADITQQPSVITLLEGADLSTFLHESGHFFFEIYRWVASQPDAPQQFRDDMEALLENIGVAKGEDGTRLSMWNTMTFQQRVEGHEKIARSFEGYLYTGRAPSIRLQSLFNTFARWLKGVYYHLRQLKINLTPEVTAVFDRMLATDDEIELAKQARSMMPLFVSEEQSGLDPDAWRKYQESQQQHDDEAKAELTARRLRDQRWSREEHGRELRKLKKAAAQTRAQIRREVEAEVRAQPIYQAIEFLKKGLLPDGTKTDGGFKLSIEEIDAMFPDEAARNVVKRALGTGAYGMMGRENGIHPNQVAELFGFSSGDELVRALVAAMPIESEIEGRVEQRMLEEHAELSNEKALEEAADRAINNSVRARIITTEINALNKMLEAKEQAGTDSRGRPRRRRILPEAARQFAAQTVARVRYRDLSPSMYSAAAERARKAAEKAFKAGDLETAVAEKRNELFNVYAARAAADAKLEVEKALRYFQRLDSEGARKRIDPDYREQIMELLTRYDLRRNVTLKDLDRRANLAAWVERQRENGFDPVIPEELINDTRLIHYKNLTIDEIRNIVDAVRNIEHLGRLKNRLLTDKKNRELTAAAEKASDAIRENATSAARTVIERNSFLDRTGKALNQFFALHRKWNSLFRQMDGNRESGILWQLFVRPLNEAGDAEAKQREAATIALYKILKPLIDAGGLKRKMFIPEIGASLSKEARIVIALNWGNEQNRQRVMDGDRWTREQVLAILRTLTMADWQVVQGIWNHLDSYWPAVAAKERRVTGVAPQRVEPLPFEIETADGQIITLGGGYYPLKYDPDRSDKADAHDMADMVKQAMQGAHTRATTKRGHTKARVEKVDRAVRKDLGVLFQHLTEVIHDLTHHEVLIDLNRLLRREEITSAIREHYGPEVLRALKKTVEDVAVGDVPAQNIFEAAINHVRTGVTIAGMGWNLLTGLLQPLGLTQSIVRVGPKYVAKGLAKWMANAASFESTRSFIEERSDFMRLRAKTLQREINEIRNQIAGKSKVRLAVEESFFILIAKLQTVADYPTWLGAYEKAYDQDPSIDDETASRLADQAVIDSQGSGQIKDLAAVQRGGPLLKLWTNFYSYFNVTYNLMAEQTDQRRREGGARRLLLATDVLLLMILPSVLATLLREAMMVGVGGEPPDEEELLEKLAKEQISYLTGTMVGLREFGSMISSPVGYNSPAGLRFFVEVGRLVQQAEQGEVDEAFLKAANNTAGILFHYPAGQVQRTVTGIQSLAEGETTNPLVIATGPPPER